MLGSVQLTFSVNSFQAMLNGKMIALTVPPIKASGRTMLPLEETARLLSQPLNKGSSTWSLGNLTINPERSVAWLAGAQQETGQVITQEGVLFIAVRLLADVLQANLDVSHKSQLITLTALRGGGDPSLPQARFSTDKEVYAPGERVVYTEYPFDPDGANITARKWQGRQDAFFDEGEYTISLQVQNARGARSKWFKRTIRVQGNRVDNPVSFALKYNKIGQRLNDPMVMDYPVATAQTIPLATSERFPLLFSDSPEKPNRSGLLYQDNIVGRARLLAYHMNAMPQNARLYVLARNLEGRPITIETERTGETAPTRIESILGQVTLLDYFANKTSSTVRLDVGQTVALYASPTLTKGSGVNLLKDINTSGRVDLTFIMLEEGLNPTPEVVRQLPVLPLDSNHQRGTFPNAIRRMKVTLTQFPSRIVIGDGKSDPILRGVDKLTGKSMTLFGNYGLLYDLKISGAQQTAIALSPRGGIYRGAMNVDEGQLTQTIKLPKIGNALKPDKPVLLWRPHEDSLNLSLIPASGSSLPINLVFYRLNHPVHANASATLGPKYKRYRP